MYCDDEEVSLNCEWLPMCEEELAFGVGSLVDPDPAPLPAPSSNESESSKYESRSIGSTTLSGNKLSASWPAPSPSMTATGSKLRSPRSELLIWFDDEL